LKYEFGAEHGANDFYLRLLLLLPRYSKGRSKHKN
jgi:hypothetical protein